MSSFYLRGSFNFILPSSKVACHSSEFHWRFDELSSLCQVLRLRVIAASFTGDFMN